MLEWAAEQGWLIRVRRGVYLVAGVPASPWQPLMAATLAAGPKAVISHSSAAAIHRFYGIVESRPELTVPLDRCPQLKGVRVHRSATLTTTDTEVRCGVRLTTPIRTVIDLAPRTSDSLLGLILDEGAIGRLWTADQVANRLAGLGRGGRIGTSGLRGLLAERLGEGMPHSQLEQRVSRVLKRAVPPHKTHYTVVLDGVPIEMDLAWPEVKVDGEVDGFAVRAASRTKFERQLRRENILAAHGWRIVHFTAHMDDATIIALALSVLGKGGV